MIVVVKRWLALNALFATTLMGQSVVAGVVRDSLGRPVAGAQVSVEALGRRGETNDSGVFRITGVEPGLRLISVRRVGYVPLNRPVRVVADETQIGSLVLRQLITKLDTVTTTEKTLWREAPLLREFEENRKLGLGTFYTRADLEKARGRSMVSFFELTGRFTTISEIGGAGRWIASARGVRSLNNECATLEDRTGPISPPNGNCACFPIVYLDFQRLSVGHMVPNINRFRPDDLEAVEIYAGGAQTPPRYQTLNSECGVIVFHSRRPPEKDR
jgi:hypothetical protein